jgi:hypothetical protein
VTQRSMPPSAIRVDEIRTVRLGRRVMSPMIEVDHAGIDVTSPPNLYSGSDSPQAGVLLSLASADATGTVPPMPTTGADRGVAATASLEAKPRRVPGPMRAMDDHRRRVLRDPVARDIRDHLDWDGGADPGHQRTALHPPRLVAPPARTRRSRVSSEVWTSERQAKAVVRASRRAARPPEL